MIFFQFFNKKFENVTAERPHYIYYFLYTLSLLQVHQSKPIKVN